MCFVFGAAVAAAFVIMVFISLALRININTFRKFHIHHGAQQKLQHFRPLPDKLNTGKNIALFLQFMWQLIREGA